MLEYIDREHPEERWKVVKDYPNYVVSDQGRVYSLKRKRFLKPVFKSGHLAVSLCNNGQTKAIFIHRLVATAFLDNPFNQPFVCHYDDDPNNNAASNLYWGNGVTNAEDRLRNGKVKTTPVVGYNENTGEECYFDSIVDAANYICSRPSTVRNNLIGNSSGTKGWKFEYDIKES